MRALAAVFLGAALLGGGRHAAAQEPATLPAQTIDSGALVRMHLISGDTVCGRLLARLAPTSARVVYCRYPGSPCSDSTAPGFRRQPVGSIRLLELGVHPRPIWAYAALGGVMGVGSAWLAQQTLGRLCDEGQCRPVPWLPLALAGIVWGVVYASESVTWRPAP